MKKISLMLLALLGSAVLLSSCHKDDNQVNYQVGDQVFVTDASSSNSFEIQAGKLAMTRGTSDSVKVFADSMVNDNTKIAAKLSTVASQNGLTVSTTLQPVDQNNLNALNALTGVAFDKQYAAIMVMAHQGALSLFGSAAATNGVGNPSLRAFAGAQVAGLETQLVLSQRLVQAVSSESGQ
jgi:putative membrane protein